MIRAFIHRLLTGQPACEHEWRAFHVTEIGRDRFVLHVQCRACGRVINKPVRM